MARSGRSSEKKKKQNNNGNMAALGVGVKKGPWTAEEDRKLLAYIQQFGHGSWRSLPAKAGNHDLLCLPMHVFLVNFFSY